MIPTEALPAITIVAIAAIIIGISIRADRKRAEKIENIAVSIGARYEKQININENPLIENLRFFTRRTGFGKGWSLRPLKKVMTGTIRGHDWIFGDFTYREGKNSRTQTIAVTKIQNTPVPDFTLKENNFFYRMFRKDNIELSGNPEFSKKYLLYTNNKAKEKGEEETEKLKKLFHPQLVNYIFDMQTKINIESENQKIVFHSGYSAIPVKKYRKFAEDCFEIIQMIDKESIF